MKIIGKRGRPVENDTLILQYTQEFKDLDGTTYKWVWDLTKSRGPLSVTINDPQYDKADKLMREISKIHQSFEAKKGDRKPRITKEAKEKIAKLEKELDDFQKSLEQKPEKVPTKKQKLKKLPPSKKKSTRGRKPKII